MWRKRKADINELLQSDDNNAVTIDNAVTTNDREETINDDGGSNADEHSTSVTTDGTDFDTDTGMCDSDVEILNPEPEVEVRNLGDDLQETCTSHAEQLEDEDEDGEVVVQKRKSKTFEDFVEGSDLCEASAEGEDKEEWKGDASPIIPVFPTPPIKISKNVGRDRSNSGSPRSAGSDRSTSGSPRSAGRDRSTSGSPRSAGRDRSTSGSPRSAGRNRSTSGSSRSRSVGRDSSSGRVPRSQAMESRSLDGLSHARPIYNRAVPTTFPLSEAKFQKIVVTKLVTLTDEVKKLQRTLPNSGIDISKIDTLEEFEREEASFLEKNKFETLYTSAA
ncbi:uncharacterized protein LOC119904812 [Micropterus salmoides]|uniref:uncharacterized protein LOC119904812 n=1 Tax=Micropterus salmoides TaxID=27706 RepID=UPI0018EC9098|nr:uncharacterized protein LOC119904812 [Micropterus salmoides]